MVPVCLSPARSPSSPLYELAICATVSHIELFSLIEWLEFHLLVGVRHFFLYCLPDDAASSPLSNYRLLKRQLQDYIAARQVTLVPWPYEGCVRHMETGRSLHFMHCVNGSSRFQKDEEMFLPTSIAASAAAASCFSRFKSLCQFIGHLDLDEFFFVSPRSGSSMKKELRGAVPAEDSLLAFVRKVFDRKKAAPAIAFTPVSMLSCPSLGSLRDQSSFNATSSSSRGLRTYLPPRLGRYVGSELGVVYEVKLIARAAAVDFLFTHFVPQLSSSQSDRDGLRWSDAAIEELSASKAALLHFRKDGGVGGVMFECKDLDLSLEDKHRQDNQIRCKFSFPMTLDRRLQQRLIRDPRVLRRLEEKRRLYSRPERLDYLILGLDRRSIDMFISNFQSRLHSLNLSDLT